MYARTVCSRRTTRKKFFLRGSAWWKKKDVLYIEVPKYDELSVKNMYDKLLKLPGMAEYFPEKYPKGRQCDREYLFNVANTLDAGVV